MTHYRVTRPERYNPNTPGHRNVSARQGYYAEADSPEQAAKTVHDRLVKDGTWGSGAPETTYDVQPWDDQAKVPTVHYAVRVTL